MGVGSMDSVEAAGFMDLAGAVGSMVAEASIRHLVGAASTALLPMVRSIWVTLLALTDSPLTLSAHMDLRAMPSTEIISPATTLVTIMQSVMPATLQITV